MEDAAIVALYWARDEQALAETATKFGAYCRKIADNILHSAHRRRGMRERHLAGRLEQHAHQPTYAAGSVSGAHHAESRAGPL